MTATVSQESVRYLCGRLIEAVGMSVRHRRLKHGGRHVLRCVTCQFGAETEQDLVRDIARAVARKPSGGAEKAGYLLC